MRKLSELSTEECCEVLCEIAQPVQNIVDDEALMKTIGKGMETSKKKELTFVGTVMAASSRIVSALPVLLKEHRNDVYIIISTIGGTSVDEVAAQNILTTMQQVREILTDKQLIDFFRPSKHTEATES